MTPETLERFRRRFHKIYLGNPTAEALAQAGCTLIGEIERLTVERDQARAMVLVRIRESVQALPGQGELPSAQEGDLRKMLP